MCRGWRTGHSVPDTLSCPHGRSRSWPERRPYERSLVTFVVFLLRVTTGETVWLFGCRWHTVSGRLHTLLRTFGTRRTWLLHPFCLAIGTKKDKPLFVLSESAHTYFRFSLRKVEHFVERVLHYRIYFILSLFNESLDLSSCCQLTLTSFE